MLFAWNDRKAASNLRKHGVSFEEAKGAFRDPNSIEQFDPEHSREEDRFFQIGATGRGRLVVVHFTVRGATKRLISARMANGLERRQYEGS